MNLTGKMLGKYQMGPEIGRGGMGAVYKGYDPALRRTVAIKVLAPHLTWEKRFVDRFLREARTVAQLSHPHIVAIHDVGIQDGTYYLVMAFVEGETLRNLVAREGPLPPRRVAEILSQVAQALDYAHRRGVVHRDVKPGNILMESGRRPVLTDFGIAQAAQGTRLTATGMSLGTPEYMSPEQARGDPTDARSDVYSLGIVLYEMLTGHVPFRADTPLAVLRMQADSTPPSPRRFIASLSPEVEGVVLKALSKDPAKRYPSAGSLVKALVEAIRGRLSAAEIEELRKVRESTAAFPTRQEKVSRARPAWLWLAPVLLVIVAVGVAFAALGGKQLVSSATPTSPSVMSTPAVPTDVLPPSSIAIEYILSAANTMMQPLDRDQSKLDAARSALSQHWQTLGPVPNLGLRAYGHRLSAADPDSCLDTRLLAPAAQGQVSQLVALLQDVSARGMAPLSQALIEASGDPLISSPESIAALILIADGADSCGEDACAVVKIHQEAGLRYPIHVIGLAMSGEPRQELVCIAEASGGTYRDAASEAEVTQALNQFAQTVQANAP